MDIIMDMFNRLFMESTNPTTEYTQLLVTPAMYISILLHTLVYTAVAVVLFPQYRRRWYVVSIVLACVMFIGYIMRLARIKSMRDIEGLPDELRAQYLVWYFLG